MSPESIGIARDTGLRLFPDPRRVVGRPFVPGLEEVGPTGSRAGAVIQRVLLLQEDAVEAALADVMARFADRHRDLEAKFLTNAARVLALVDPNVTLSSARLLLLGSCFTHEYSTEAAALCNPSIVLLDAPPTGTATPFVMSVRGIGEGHKSSIGFRTGTIGTDGQVHLDEPSPYLTTVEGTPGLHHRSVFHYKLDMLGDDLQDVAHFLHTLPATFDNAQLAAALEAFSMDASMRRLSPNVLDHVTHMAHWSYKCEFPEHTDISERVLWPHAPPEFHGMEDARFVRFTDDDGAITYFGTYTAFDRSDVSLQLLATPDFRTFSSSPVAGAAAVGKGLAIFPRKINGRYVALTRADRETNGIAHTDDLYNWATSESLEVPQAAWEVLQLGNCGSPMETDEGWLVLTHGVGPMRTYSIGALLLDLEQPNRIIRRAMQPLISPDATNRDGYVPNVVYSCGGVIHDGTLVLPFGVADEWISIATVPVRELIDAMEPVT